MTLTPTTKRYVLIGAAALVALVAVSGVTMATTSKTEYCLTCHEMTANRDEMKASSHAVDKDKKAVDCAACHIPIDFGGRYLVVKTVVGLNDVFVHAFGDTENLSRRDMQAASRRFIPDENCLYCHKDLNKDAKGEKDISPLGKVCHEAYLGKNGNTRSNCAGCHQNMAHLPVFDFRYDANAKFVQKLAELAANKEKAGK